MKIRICSVISAFCLLMSCAATPASRKTSSVEVSCPSGMSLIKECRGSGPTRSGNGKIYAHVALCADGEKFSLGMQDSGMNTDSLLFMKKTKVDGLVVTSFYNSRPNVENGELTFLNDDRTAATFTDGPYFEANYKADLKCQ